jgi:PadR family transcriptional regulator AphA
MDTKILCLGVLSRGDATGYEITKACETGPFRHFHETSFGSVYPALGRLHEEGLVRFTEMAQDKRPDKKVYSITEAGNAALAEALSQRPADDHLRSEFLFMLFFSQFLPPERVGRLIDERVAAYEDGGCRLSSEDLAALRPGERFVHGFGVAVRGAAAAYLRQHRDELVAELQATREEAPSAAPGVTEEPWPTAR